VSGRTLGLIELLLVFGLAIGFAAWELWSLRRARRRRRAEETRADRQRHDDPPR
jgi:hypothetical protein